MPMDRRRYPADWERIARGVKDAAGWRCQACGKRCRRPGEPFDTHRRTLTVAHLNHTPEDCRPENLAAMCAPCHLRYDAAHHAETRMARSRGDGARASPSRSEGAGHPGRPDQPPAPGLGDRLSEEETEWGSRREAR